MTPPLRTLAKDTAIYGLSSIVGKTLNWLLTPLFTYTLATTGQYGIITNLYACVALAIIILTFGMETGLFRFSAQNTDRHPDTVYTTTLIAVGAVVLLFLTAAILCLQPLTTALGADVPPECILMLALTLSMDAFSAIPFARLRYKRQAIRFAALKMLFIVLYIGLCCFFLLLCPILNERRPQLIAWFYKPDAQLTYIFLANLLATLIQTACLLPELCRVKYRFDPALLRKMLRYSLPLLVLGIAGMLSQTADKIIFPLVYPDPADAMNQLGIYGACFKIAVVMVMFTQAFRYAYEPFIFAKHTHTDNKPAYAQAMKYFIIFGLMIFLAVTFYIDWLKLFVAPQYHPGLAVVPIVMAAELFFGIYFNLSLWYKLTDKTVWGAGLSLVGSALIVALNILFIPAFGYMACAWASFAGYFVIMLCSYFAGQKRFPVNYDLRSIFLYLALAAALYTTSLCIEIPNPALRLLFRTALLAVYCLIVLKRDLLPRKKP
jgi:O-antigen/teichoic acid export membrane protein